MLDFASLQGNRLFASLSTSDKTLLYRHLTPCKLEHHLVIYEANAIMQQAYFPLTACLSAITIMTDGLMIEAGTIGNEGAVGLLYGASSPNRVVVQIPGNGARIEAELLSDALKKSNSLQAQVAAYQSAYVAQLSRSVACNGLHRIEQRCCRWLLMTRDRVTDDTFPLTHEYLSHMLGVRRAGVTEVLQSLKERGVLDYTRGSVTILNRKGLEAVVCECYGAVCEYYRKLYGA